MNEDVRSQLMNEGQTESVTPEPTSAPAAEPVADPRIEALEAKLTETTGKLASLQETAELVERAKGLFFKQDTGTKLSQKDLEIKQELERLYPGLNRLGEIDQLKSEIQKAGQSAQQGVAEVAWSYQQTLQKEFGIGAGDPEVAEMIGVNIKTWLGKDQSRLNRYFTGDKEVIREGFEHVVGKMYGPDRIAGKRRTLDRVRNTPVVPGRAGVAGGGGVPATDKIDFSDRKSVRNALRAYSPGDE